ncbi:MAG: 1,4-dihydroxy-6-naphthoate synthase [Nitrospiraceae bacterium]|nr:1,4-dihydroxy-6-naphthoate synthase [Nitrospiraceae bacterium]
METARKRVLSLGFSPCPNDTFIFYALVHGRIKKDGLAFREVLEDVETLNRKALRGELDVTKISYHALGHLRENYVALRSGAALGKGCGPLLVARGPLDPGALKGGKIAVPGGLTTAYLLLMLFEPSFRNNTVPMVFSDIMPAVRDGRVDAGLVIHEGRFTYQNYGLHCLMDLGDWWEGRTELPIPLGGIIARRSLGTKVLRAVEEAVRESVLYTRSHPEEAASYIKGHAQEIDTLVINSHIGLYVNDFTVDIGSEGENALRVMFEMAGDAGIFEGPGKTAKNKNSLFIA